MIYGDVSRPWLFSHAFQTCTRILESHLQTDLWQLNMITLETNVGGPRVEHASGADFPFALYLPVAMVQPLPLTNHFQGAHPPQDVYAIAGPLHCTPVLASCRERPGSPKRCRASPNGSAERSQIWGLKMLRWWPLATCVPHLFHKWRVKILDIKMCKSGFPDHGRHWRFPFQC